MDDIEERLRKAMARQSPSSGFAARVAPIATDWDAKREMIPQPKWFFRWAVAAILVIAAIGIFASYQRRREREQGELAKRQILAALRITNDKLQLVQHRMQHLSDQ